MIQGLSNNSNNVFFVIWNSLTLMFIYWKNISISSIWCMLLFYHWWTGYQFHYQLVHSVFRTWRHSEWNQWQSLLKSRQWTPHRVIHSAQESEITFPYNFAYIAGSVVGCYFITNTSLPFDYVIHAATSQEIYCPKFCMNFLSSKLHVWPTILPL